MPRSERSLTLFSFLVGFTASSVLTLAISTDYWLFTGEPFDTIWVNPDNSSDTEQLKGTTYSHSGLWRLCIIVEPGKL